VANSAIFLAANCTCHFKRIGHGSGLADLIPFSIMNDHSLPHGESPTDAVSSSSGSGGVDGGVRVTTNALPSSPGETWMVFEPDDTPTPQNRASSILNDDNLSSMTTANTGASPTASAASNPPAKLPPRHPPSRDRGDSIDATKPATVLRNSSTARSRAPSIDESSNRSGPRPPRATRQGSTTTGGSEHETSLLLSALAGLQIARQRAGSISKPSAVDARKVSWDAQAFHPNLDEGILQAAVGASSPKRPLGHISPLTNSPRNAHSRTNTLSSVEMVDLNVPSIMTPDLMDPASRPPAAHYLPPPRHKSAWGKIKVKDVIALSPVESEADSYILKSLDEYYDPTHIAAAQAPPTTILGQVPDGVAHGFRDPIVEEEEDDASTMGPRSADTSKKSLGTKTSKSKKAVNDNDDDDEEMALLEQRMDKPSTGDAVRGGGGPCILAFFLHSRGLVFFQPVSLAISLPSSL
jgi:hypothetical protein